MNTLINGRNKIKLVSQRIKNHLRKHRNPQGSRKMKYSEFSKILKKSELSNVSDFETDRAKIPERLANLATSFFAKRSRGRREECVRSGRLDYL